jgi:hypothetical protein
MRGAPHSGFATLISRMSWRISSGVLGRPPRGLDFQRHQARNPARCHLDDGLRLEDFHRVQHLGSQLIEPRKHQAIDIADGNPLGRLTPQHIELITRYPVDYCSTLSLYSLQQEPRFEQPCTQDLRFTRVPRYRPI